MLGREAGPRERPDPREPDRRREFQLRPVLPLLDPVLPQVVPAQRGVGGLRPERDRARLLALDVDAAPEDLSSGGPEDLAAPVDLSPDLAPNLQCAYDVRATFLACFRPSGACTTSTTGQDAGLAWRETFCWSNGAKLVRTPIPGSVVGYAKSTGTLAPLVSISISSSALAARRPQPTASYLSGSKDQAG